MPTIWLLYLPLDYFSTISYSEYYLLHFESLSLLRDELKSNFPLLSGCYCNNNRELGIIELLGSAIDDWILTPPYRRLFNCIEDCEIDAPNPDNSESFLAIVLGCCPIRFIWILAVSSYAYLVSALTTWILYISNCFFLKSEVK